MKLLSLGISIAGLAAWCTGSITILTGGEPKPYHGALPLGTPDAFYRLAAPNEFVDNSTSLVFADFDDSAFATETNLQPSSDSFVRGAIQAWAEHLHLVIRPDEVWFAILTQMTFYINAHSNATRELIADPPAEAMEVRLEEVDWYVLVHRMRNRLQDRYKVEWLADWVNPGFTTTVDADFMAASIIMLGTAKTNFNAPSNISCGLPSVTLRGIQADWEAISARLDKLPLFGPGPAAYHDRLQAILKKFIQSFESPDSLDTKAFWNQIVSSKTSGVCGDTPHHVTGWLTGFFYWDDNGAPFGRSKDGFSLGNQTYPVLDLRQLPIAYSRAPFGLLGFNNTTRFETYILSGNLCKSIVDGPPEGYFDALNRTSGQWPKDNATHSTLSVLSSWAVVGPVLWNATGQQWRSGPEPTSLESSIKQSSGNGMCASKR